MEEEIEDVGLIPETGDDDRSGGWDDGDDAESTEEETEVEETEEESEVEESEETEESEEESEEDPEDDEEEEDELSEKEQMLATARAELEAEDEALAEQAESEIKSSLRPEDLQDVLDEYDLEDLKFPNPMGEGDELSLSEIKNEFPGIAEYTESLIGAAIGDYKDKIGKLESFISSKLLLIEVRMEHPDVQSVVSSDEFTKWLSGQSDEVNYFLEEGNAKDVNLVLKRYKKTIAPKEEEVITPKKVRARPAPKMKRKSVTTRKVSNKDLMSRSAGWNLD